MPSTTPPQTSVPGVLHYIPDNISAFEPSKPLVRSLNINTLIWIGGMGDTFMSVAYPYTLAQALGPTWSLMAASLGSAGLSWGVGSIAEDAEDIADIVAYVEERRPGGKIVLMGHSTGCQDCMEYLVGANADKRPSVEGVILQAPVSDREALTDELPRAIKQQADQLALKMCREGQAQDVMPHKLTNSVYGSLAITARRWVDVSSPGPDHSGADDYFSSDLPVERLKKTFGKFPASTPLLILHSGSDDSVPDTVNKLGLVQSWATVIKDGGGVVDEANSGVVEGASHNLNGDPEHVVQNLVGRVLAFLAR